MKETLLNPDWIIPAILVAIFGGLIVVYLKQLIDKVISRISSRYKKYRDKKNEAFEGMTDLIANDQTLLIGEFMLTLLFSIAWAVSLLSVLLFYILSLQTDGSDSTFYRIASYFFVLPGVTAFYHSYRRTKRVGTSYIKYLDSKTLKKRKFKPKN